jgi:hypothetical protein
MYPQYNNNKTINSIQCGQKYIHSFFFSVLGLELRAYTLIHSTSPIFVMIFLQIGSQELFAWD